MSEPMVSTETIKVTNFVWKDGEVKLPAGELLGTLIILSESEKKTNKIDDKPISDYLVNKGYIERVKGTEYRTIPEKKDELIELGNKLSDGIGKELEKHIDKTTEILPTVMFMATHKK